MLGVATIFATPRKKVAVVLSGGGAKGMAHISALKVIEEAGIPIDIVVGTSMGSIIGGLYAIGYTPTQLDTIVKNLDWETLLTDKSEHNKLSFMEKRRRDTYSLSLPLTKNVKDLTSGGFVKGKNIYNKLIELTESVHHIEDFDKLPRSFACVAFDIVKGKEKVFHTGELATAMRASMSIPGVFTPVHLDSMVLIDGGMVNNYPADIAKSMGADIIIGIDVQDEYYKKEELNSVGNVASQILNVIVSNKFEENKKLTDIYIYVPLKGYTAASFTATDIDSIMNISSRYSYNKMDELLALKKRIGMEHLTINTPTLPYHKPDTAERYTPLLTNIDSIGETNEVGRLNLGVRFDTEELAALTVNANVQLPNIYKSEASITARLGQRTFGRLNFALNPLKETKIDLGYEIQHNDLNYNYKGTRFYTTTALFHKVKFSISSTWREKFKAEFGAFYEYYNYKHFLSNTEENIPDVKKKESLITYYASVQFNNYNKRSYPTRGASGMIRYELITNDFVSYKSEHPISVFAGQWEAAFAVNDRLTFQPSIAGRALIYKELPFSKINFIGGDVHGRFISHQMAFSGMGGIEMVSPSIAIARMKVHQRIHKNYYTLLNLSYAYCTDVMHDIFSGEHLLGWNVGLGYDSILGPVEATLGYAKRTGNLHFYINAGFYF